MNDEHIAAAPETSPEFLAFYSARLGCSAADYSVGKLHMKLSATQQRAFLEETILFHHFIAMAAVFFVIRNREHQRSYLDKMVAAIKPNVHIPPCEAFELDPLKHFSTEYQEEAIKSCFSSPGNIRADLAQKFYLGQKPSETELKIMNLKTVREMTGWDSESANTVQYFAAALVARLTIALQIEPEKRLADFMNLSTHAAAESRVAFKLYIELLGAKTEN